MGGVKEIESRDIYLIINSISAVTSNGSVTALPLLIRYLSVEARCPVLPH